MFPWEQVDDLWTTKSEHVGLIVRSISFQDFKPMWSWSTNVTDRRTNGQMTCDRKTALCTIVHRAVKTAWAISTKLGPHAVHCSRWGRAKKWGQKVKGQHGYVNRHGHFSGTTLVSRHQKGKPFWISMKQKMMVWQWHQLNHTMQIVCTSLQTHNHARSSPRSFYKPDALPLSNGIKIVPVFKRLQGEILHTNSLIYKPMFKIVTSQAWRTHINKTRKLCYRKDDRVMRLIYECPESLLNVHRNLKCVVLAVPEIG